MIRAKKSLGQHFLRSKSALSAIISAGNISHADMVLEIGPGKGVLTEALLQAGATVIAIEKDSDMITLLQEKFADFIASKKLVLLEDDILDFDFTKHHLKHTEYKLIANIPYYITGAIIRKFLETKHQPSRMVLLVQKEVSDRIVARDKRESLLSISVKAYGEPHYIVKVPAKSFSPAPKVDSAVLSIQNISKKRFTDTPEDKFFTILRAGFAHKRKMVISNLAEAGFLREKIEKIFEILSISLKSRAEELTVDQWFAIVKELHR